MDDLVNQAERLRAEISGESCLPHVERNLKQLSEAGQQLWSRTTGQTPRQTADVKASVLLGSKGYDLQKTSQRLESLQGKKSGISEASFIPESDLDLDSFLKRERENDIMTMIEDARKFTIESVDNMFWERLDKEWEEKRKLIFSVNDAVKLKEDFTTTSGMTPGKGHGKEGGKESSFLGQSCFFQQQKDPSHSYLSTVVLDKRNVIEHILQMIKRGDNIDSVVGTISTDGCRVPGFLDKALQQQQSSSDIPSVDDILLSAAEECERQAFLEYSVKLYDLVGEHTRALVILNKLVAPVVAEKSCLMARTSLQDLAIRLAERYARHGSSASKSVLATFHLLLDLSTFFSYYHKGSLYDALDTIERLNLVPLEVSSIDAKVQEFKNLSPEVQRNIPEILLACLNMLHDLYKQTKLAGSSSTAPKLGLSPEGGNRDARLTQLRSKAKSLITYAGMIPYRMQREINAKLVHLEVLMN